MNLLAKVGFTLHLPGSFRQYTPLLPPRIAEDCNEHQSVRKVSEPDSNRLLEAYRSPVD